MAGLEHARYKIYSKSQHPLNHSLSDFLYGNPSAPDVKNVEGALNFILAVLYPQTKSSVDWVLDQGDGSTFLPVAGNSLGDYRNVLNGYTKDAGVTYKTAGYMWAKYDGDAVETWHKTTVFDWGTGDVASVMVDRTKLLYYFKQGLDDVDEDGNLIIGDLAGQVLYGGQSPNTNLTLNANNGDPVGHSGFIQLNDDTIPFEDGLFILGSDAKRFLTIYSDDIKTRELSVGFSAGYQLSINTTPTKAVFTHTQNNIDFGGSRLTTTGPVYISNDIQITAGIFKCINSAALYFRDAASALLDIVAGKGAFSDLLVGNELAIDGSSIICGTDSQDVTLSATNAGIILDANTVNTTTLVPLVDSMYNIGAEGSEYVAAFIDSVKTNDINTTSGDLTLGAFGLDGQIFLASEAQTINLKTTGTLTVDGKLKVDQLEFDGDTINSSTGIIYVHDSIRPFVDAVKGVSGLKLGHDSHRFSHGYFTDYLSDGAGSIIEASEWGSLRYVNYEDANKITPASEGQILIRDNLGRWLASDMESIIDHADINGLGSDDHTQYVMLNGRFGGQIIAGGLTNAHKLHLQGFLTGRSFNISDVGFMPSVTSAMDIGSLTHKINNLYLSGEIKTGRIENVAALPAAGSAGHLVFNTTDNSVYADTGADYIRVGGKSCKGTFTQGDLAAAINVSKATGHANLTGYVDDAVDCLWQLKNSTGEVLAVKITVTTTTVTVSTSIPLPAGNYRLVGVEA